MTTTNDITALRTATTNASAWTGLSWESAPANALTSLERAVSLAGQRDDDSPEIAARLRIALRAAAEPSGGCWWRDDGSHRSQQLRTDWRDLLAEVEALTDESSADEIETARQHAEWLADAERGVVESDAAAAAEHGSAAIAAAERGEWDECLEWLESAARLEREYGDEPMWGPAVAEAKRLADEAAAAE